MTESARTVSFKAREAGARADRATRNLRLRSLALLCSKFFHLEAGTRPQDVATQLRAIEARHSRSYSVISDLTRQLTDIVVDREGNMRGYTPDRPATSRTDEAWARGAQAMIQLIQGQRIPWTLTGRAASAKAFRAAANEYLGESAAQLRAVDSLKTSQISDLRRATWEQWTRNVRGILQALDDDYPLEVGNGMQASYGSEGQPTWISGSSADPDSGPPLVSVGTVWASSVSGSHREGFPLLRGEQNAWALELNHTFVRAMFGSPLLLDLDHWGGFVTNDPGFAQVGVLDLLTMVPAGRLRIDAFDPEHLGESLDYLFGLGEASSRVIGDAVWTTPQHIAKVLVQLEEHVTYVTQKYLQGQYKTISEFNMAAGEVAEPYRLLLLHDFPAGFSRDGRYQDEEALNRLARLARVGRRAGVYVIATVDKPDQALRDLPYISPQLTSESATAFGFPIRFDGLGEGEGGTPALDVSWSAKPWPRPTSSGLAAIHATIQQMFQAASSIRVDAGKVSDLAARHHDDKVAKGLVGQEIMARPDNPETWWHGTSVDALQARFGRAGARDVATLRLDCVDSSSALIGGRTGSGKSVLIHSIIGSLVMQYSPAELELYLIDLKEGVEFKTYAAEQLPHARVVAIESNREFALSVLDSVDEEIRRRGEVIRAGGGEQMDLTSYRKGGDRSMARVVLVVDEFQVLFEKEDQIHRRSLEVLERIIRQGRAFGVHAVLASQSVTGSAAAIRSLIGQIPNRVVLASSEADSRMLLADNNGDADSLTRPGEGILNTKAGLKEANERFQCAFWSGEDRAALVAGLRKRADAQGFTRRPVVFEGYAPVNVSEVAPDQLVSPAPMRELLLPLGLPMSLAGPIAGRLGRSPGGNALIVDARALDVLSVAVTGWLASGVQPTLVNFVGDDDPAWSEALGVLSEAGLKVRYPSTLPTVLHQVDVEVQQRQTEGDYKSPPIVLALAGVQRARQLDPNDYADDSCIAVLRRILTAGPEVGVHTVLAVDKVASLDRRLSSTDLRELGLRVLGGMAESDSQRLIDQPVAAKIKVTQLVLDDFDRSITEVVRRYDMVTADWVKQMIGGVPGA